MKREYRALQQTTKEWPLLPYQHWLTAALEKGAKTVQNCSAQSQIPQPAKSKCYCIIINKCNQCCIYPINNLETQLEGWMIWDRSMIAMVAMNSSVASDANLRMAGWNLPRPSAWGIPLPTLKWLSKAQVGWLLNFREASTITIDPTDPTCPASRLWSHNHKPREHGPWRLRDFWMTIATPLLGGLKPWIHLDTSLKGDSLF